LGEGCFLVFSGVSWLRPEKTGFLFPGVFLRFLVATRKGWISEAGHVEHVTGDATVILVAWRRHSSFLSFAIADIASV
jgi:hypothetical protein